LFFVHQQSHRLRSHASKSRHQVRVAVCCSVLLRAAACCCVLQRVVAACCILLLFVARNALPFSVVPTTIVSPLRSTSNNQQQMRVFQCVTACNSVLQRVAACCSVLQRVAACCSVLQRIAACCSVLQLSAANNRIVSNVTSKGIKRTCCSVLQRVAACCSVL